jgi:YHS domain-containing protein
MRPLLFLLLAITLGYVISRLFFPRRRVRPASGRGASPGIAEEMVRDPVCQLYLPRTEAIRRKVQGREFFFCSPGCFDKFLVRRS